MKLIIAFIALAMVACSGSGPAVVVHEAPPISDANPIPPPTPVKPPEADLTAVCAKLATFSCPEAKADSRGRACPEHLAAARAERVVIPSACIADAKTVDALRACGDSSTLRFRCLSTTGL